MTPQTTIMSALLCDLDTAPEPVRQTVGGPLLRALRVVDPDYAASVAAGHVEDLNTWAARVLGPEDAA
ncbi:hypothetical protein AB0K23_01225 [Streptomyces sp. NPDC049602]|uniref:hypothetical protein n=1 Tax=Streptomyces sp. NPDC049602 TaxID=3155504 RepID=UPI003414C135